MSTVETDVVVVGAGPVGLFAVFALGQVGLSATVVDALHEVGGQCAALYPEKPIYDIPSRAAVTGGELVRDLLRQSEPYAPRFLLDRRVEALEDLGSRFALRLSDGTSVVAGAVLLASGAGAFGPKRPPVDGIAAYEDASVFYAVRSPEQFRDRRVVIAGGGDSATDWAVVLAGVAASVTVVHRRPTFRAAPATVSMLRRLAAEGRIAIVAPGVLRDVEGDAPHLHTVVVDDGAGNLTRLPADVLLCFFGLSKDLSVLSGWELGADRTVIHVEPSSMSTRRAGVFAVGDIAQYPGKLKLILTGFAEAVTAAHAARVHLMPERSFHFEHSTTRGVPGLQRTAAGA